MAENARFSPPYLGVAYYPEAWPEDQVDVDVAWMKKAGINVARVAEFAWARMEPREGVYDLNWLQSVVEKLAAADIATVMCTPSATPPAWLTSNYPEVLFVNPDGRRIGHGGRRHTCPNNETYRDLCARITRRMAQVFGRDDRIIGWQIDNEVAPHSFKRACCCPVCLRKFRAFLRDSFGTIDALNQAWNLNLWSQRYNDFSQVPAPDEHVWHHPSLLQAWDEFNSASYVEFVKDQADILHEMTDHPIGTDMMPFLEMDPYDMNRHLDVVQFNHYNYFEGLRDGVMWFDFLRPVKGAAQPFWNTETSTCWSGNVATSGQSEPGFCRANSWMPIALGGEANMYWLWRTHWAGQELMHGSVMSTEGRPMHIFGEVREIADGFGKCAGFLNRTYPVHPGLGLHFSHRSWAVVRNQPIQHGLNYTAEVLKRFHEPLVREQFRLDVIDTTVDLSRYRMLISPCTPALDENGLRPRLREWVENGGIWVAGPFTDSRDPNGAKYTHAPFGSLEDWAGVHCKYQVPGHPRPFKVRWADGDEAEGAVWCNGFEVRDAEALATYTENELAGLAAVTQRRLGTGKVVVMGTCLAPAQFVRLARTLAAEAGIAPVAEASGNLLAVPRAGEAGEGIVLVEMENKPATATLPRPGTNLLTGEAVSGTLEIPPYGVAVVQYG